MRLTGPLLLPLLLLAFNSFQILAQDQPCGTVVPEGYLPPHIANPGAFEEYKSQFLEDYELREGKNSTGQRASGSCINSVPLAIWIIRTSAGTGGYSISDFNAAMTIVNARYASACLEFYACEINYIDNSTYYDFIDSEESALTAAHFTAGALNVYFANSVGNGSQSYCGYAYYPGGPNVVMMDNSCANNTSTLAHELGHSYSLPHTHNGGTELVNGSNCASAGDRFCDTAADPNISGDVNSSCVYTGTDTDANGAFYTPDPTNIMSYSRKLCRTFFSPEQLAAISFSHFNAPDRDLTCSILEADFEAPTTSFCDPSAQVSFTSNSTGATTYDWDFDNDGTTDATTANPNHLYSTTGAFNVALEISDGSKTVRKLINNYISVGSSMFPYNNTLSSFNPSQYAIGYTAGWEAIPSGGFREYQWNVASGPTPSAGTGPDGGHNSSGGFSGVYVHVEASGTHATGDIASLITECIEVPSAAIEPNPAIEFFYHMYGGSMGTLHLDIEVNGVWINDIMTPIVGQQQLASSDPYLLQSVALNSYAGNGVKFRFRAAYGTNYTGDIAIDDVSLVGASIPLPVELSTFQGEQLNNGYNQLAWTTASEKNSSYFELQRSIDGVSFSPIATVDARGTSFETSSYSHIDYAPLSGDNYYRLKMVDLDDSKEFSGLIVLSAEGGDPYFELFPNPANSLLTVTGTTTGDFVEIQNQLGQQIYASRIFDASGTFTISTSSLPAGLYILQLVSGQGTVKAVKKLQVAH